MSIRPVILLALGVLLMGCATTAPPPEDRHPRDPWEPYNRKVYTFNRTLDKAVLKPVAEAYAAVLPDPVEDSISNFFDNLKSLPTILNLSLQGRLADSGEMLGRFTVNTIVGMAGLFDVATARGLPDYDEDFGQTMAIWGWKSSRYFVLPLFGPSTVRDGLGRPVDTASDVLWRELVDDAQALIVLDLVQQRANQLGRGERLEEAYDEYLFVRDAWLQNRRYEITGESPTPDYEQFLDGETTGDSDEQEAEQQPAE